MVVRWSGGPEVGGSSPPYPTRNGDAIVGSMQRLDAKLAHNAQPTSVTAAQTTSPRSPSARWKILKALSDLGGRTDEELQAQVGLAANTERPRRIECVDEGWVKDSGITRPTKAGGPSIVWQITPAGIAAMSNGAQRTKTRPTATTLLRRTRKLIESLPDDLAARATSLLADINSHLGDTDAPTGGGTVGS